MALLQKPLRGLAKFLGVQTQGVLRLDQQPTLTPTLEMTDFIEPPVWTIASSNTIVQNGSLDIDVPLNRKWFVQFIGVSVTPPVGSNCNSTVIMRKFGTSQWIVVAPGWIIQSTFGVDRLHPANIRTGYGFSPGKLILEPGDRITADLFQCSAAGNNRIDFYVQVQEVEV